MIKAEVELDCEVERYSEIIKWCNVNLGNRAMWRDNVNSHNPWTVWLIHGTYVWYFAEEQYATMFKLRWS